MVAALGQVLRHDGVKAVEDDDGKEVGAVGAATVHPRRKRAVSSPATLAAGTAGFVLTTVSFQFVLLGLPAVAVAFGLTVARWQGETAWNRAQRRVRWAWARHQRYTA
jgi:hypothetical protein